MNILQNRIDSFKNNTVKWPYNGKQQYHKPETFAKAGFYFMRRPKTVDSVRCFMCDIDLGHWRPGQSPYTRHATESPTCPWALLNFPDAAASTNRTLQVNEKDPTTQPQHKVMRSARLATFNHHHYWPPNKSLKSSRRFQVASKLSDAGFYFTPTLENTARIKCPYCKATIMEPDKTIDALALHRQLNDTCPFFGHQRKLATRGGKNRRDTTASTASSDTYKTATSELDQPAPAPQEQEKEKDGRQEDNTVPQKRNLPQDEDDSIWDINHFLNIPAHVKKPTLTYGNKSTERRTRQRVLPSAGKRTHVDIFSNLDLSSSPSLVLENNNISSSSGQVKKSSLIEKMDTSKRKRAATSTTPTSTKKRASKRSSTAKDKAATPSPIIPHATVSKEPPLAVSTSSSSVSKVPAPPPTTEEEPFPDESLLMSPVFPPPDPIVLDKPLAAIPVKFNEPTSAATKEPSQSKEPPQSLESMIFNDDDDQTSTATTTPTRDKGKQRQVEHAIVPKKTSLSLSKSNRLSIPKQAPPPPPPPPSSAAASSSPTRSRNSDVAASLAQQMKYLQSTPMHHNRTVQVMDIFGDCPLSPITATTSATNTATPISRTPAITTASSSSVDGVVGRTRSVFTADGQRRRLAPSNSTSSSSSHGPAMSLDVNSAPPVTAEQKQMTVEMYVQHVVDENIGKVRQHGEQMIAAIREKSYRIKQDLLGQKQ